MFRFIKIDEHAIFEFVYEMFIENQKKYFDVNELEVSNVFYMDWDKREFTFCAFDDMDEHGNIRRFPETIHFQRLAKNMPVTTSSMFTSDRYVSYSLDELMQMQRGCGVSRKKATNEDD